MTDIILKAYDVLEQMKSDEHYIALKQSKTRMETLYTLELKAFQDAKKIYEDILDTGGTYHPDYKKAVIEMGLAKKNLYEKQDVIAYIALEKVIEKKVNDILRNITSLISERIQTPDEMGFLKKQGGSCGVH